MVTLIVTLHAWMRWARTAFLRVRTGVRRTTRAAGKEYAKGERAGRLRENGEHCVDDDDGTDDRVDGRVTTHCDDGVDENRPIAPRVENRVRERKKAAITGRL